MENEKTKDTRAYSWSFIVYPDSAPRNWRDILDNHHVKWVESPLHDKDVDGDGEAKKPHWHILMLFESKKSFEQIKEITEAVNCPIPQKAASARGLVRYMIHLDNPEKHQYERSKIIAHGGADISELLKPTASSRYQLITEMAVFIREQSITEFCDLFDAAAADHPDDWLPLLCDNSSYIVGQYIKSYRFKLETAQRKIEEARAEIQNMPDGFDKIAAFAEMDRKAAEARALNKDLSDGGGLPLPQNLDENLIDGAEY
jgi:hypothetical protein